MIKLFEKSFLKVFQQMHALTVHVFTGAENLSITIMYVYKVMMGIASNLEDERFKIKTIYN